MLYSSLIFAFISLVVYPFLLLILLASLIIVMLVLKFRVKTSVDALLHGAISRSPVNSLFASSL